MPTPASSVATRDPAQLRSRRGRRFGSDGDESPESPHREEQRNHQQQRHARHDVQGPACGVERASQRRADLPKLVLLARLERCDESECRPRFPGATAEGSVRRLVRGAPPPLDTGDDDRRPLGDEGHELLDERQLGRVVAHLVAQRGQEIRGAAPAAFELLEKRSSPVITKPRPADSMSLMAATSALRVVRRFGIPRGRFGQLS